MRSDFEPIYLQDAKRHIEWLYDKIKQRDISLKNTDIKNKKRGLLHKIFALIREIF